MPASMLAFAYRTFKQSKLFAEQCIEGAPSRGAKSGWR
jgi:hypothetical protein